MSHYCQIFESNIDESVCRIGREEILASCKGCNRTAARDYIAEKTTASMAASAAADRCFIEAKKIAIRARAVMIASRILHDAAVELRAFAGR